MDLTITGMRDPKQMDLVIHACKYFCYYLMPTIFSDDDYKVELIFKDKMEPYTIAEARWADCPSEPKHCTIEIKHFKNNYKLIGTLAHELTHTKQIFTKELIDIFDSKTDYLWKEKRFNITTEDYWLSPWEVEAYGYETVLVRKFKEYYNLSLKDINNDLQSAIDKINKKNSVIDLFQ